MRIHFLTFIAALSVSVFAQNPHGAGLTIDCVACHSPEGWQIAKSAWDNGKLVNPNIEDAFDHAQTVFPLTGQHAFLDCSLCHESLVFSEANSECISCHTDLHQMTVGSDCMRCHSTENWLVDDVFQLHVDNGFPLMGEHAVVNCFECHVSESTMRFDRLGNDCINCHLDDFIATTMPDHEAAGYSLDCMECHDIAAPDWYWSSGFANHSFFPLVKGHDTRECAACHTTANFADISSDCFSCHQADFEMALSPNHQVLGFSTDCASCHTIDPNWMPAKYEQHDADHFPIYSGAHNGEWDACSDCHTNPNDYSVFSCTVCHQKNSTDNEHNGVSGYVYESNMCLACHPTGDEGNAFDHNNTNFPLTGAHNGLDCSACHANGFEGTPTDCAACHTADFQQTANPNHEQVGFPMDCVLCHTTDPGWDAGDFVQHDDLFPIFSGNHQGEWNDCNECHTTPNNFMVFSCIDCHEHNDPADLAGEHHDVLGYSYESNACFNCHPKGN